MGESPEECPESRLSCNFPIAGFRLSPKGLTAVDSKTLSLRMLISVKSMLFFVFFNNSFNFFTFATDLFTEILWVLG
jgi:hypothetical protein